METVATRRERGMNRGRRRRYYAANIQGAGKKRLGAECPNERGASVVHIKTMAEDLKKEDKPV